MDQPNHSGSNHHRRLFVGLFLAATFGMMIVLSIPVARFLPGNPFGPGGILGLPRVLGPFGVLLPPVLPWTAPTVQPRPVAAWTPVSAAPIVPTGASGGRVTDEGPPVPPVSRETPRQMGRSVPEPSAHLPAVCRGEADTRGRRPKACAGLGDRPGHEQKGLVHARHGGGNDHGNPGHGNPGHGNPGHGNPGHGNPGHGNPGHGKGKGPR